ncbi:MAG: hypothetical protein K8R57_06565 [Verrucomicrobia bacterium]|nr:hypothetical protein [Verrucomicrobiota bacterium]
MPKPCAASSGRQRISTFGDSGAFRHIHRQIDMKRIIGFLFITFASLVLAADAVPTNKYSLSVGRVYESKPERPEWVFIFGGTSAIRGGETVCLSPETLKKLFKGLPRGSTLDCWPTCDGESEALAGHLDDLKKICTEAGIVFTIHPAG